MFFTNWVFNRFVLDQCLFICIIYLLICLVESIYQIFVSSRFCVFFLVFVFVFLFRVYGLVLFLTFFVGCVRIGDHEEAGITVGEFPFIHYGLNINKASLFHCNQQEVSRLLFNAFLELD